MTALFPQDAQRPSGEPSWIVPAKIEPLVGAAVRPRWQVLLTLSADEQGPFKPSDVSFLSGEKLERAPLRAVAVQLLQQKGLRDVLRIDVERVGPGDFVVPEAILVVLRGKPPSDEAVTPFSPVVSGINYLARDFDSFRKLMLDRMTSLAPTWTDTTPADLGVMLVEVLAYLADDLSYWQDAIATEAYLQTARRELSVQRHTRLLGYWLDQGMGARAWVQLSANRLVTVPKGTELLAGLVAQPLTARDTMQYQQYSALATAVFETLMDRTVDPNLDEIALYDEDRSSFVIAAGATSAVAVIPGQSLPQIGDVLLFESRSPSTSADYPPHPVCLTGVGTKGADNLVELQWDKADAPRTDLPVTRRIHGVVQQGLSILRGNVTLADFGQTSTQKLPVRTDGSTPYEPFLPYSIVSSAPAPAPGTPAARWTTADPAQIRPAIVLQEYCDPEFLVTGPPASPEARLGDSDITIPKQPWTPVPDLLLSGPYSRVFVVEPQEEEGGTSLRFGDGVFGLAPPVGSRFVATFRVGDMALSNVGVGAIATIVMPDGAGWIDAELRVTNPIAAAGGHAGETLTQAKQMAPALVTDIQAAITAPDYVAIARGVGGVADAAAVLRWTGSWFTMFVYVRVTGQCSALVLSQVEDALAVARVAGRAIVVREPVWVGIDLRMRITLSPGFGPEQVSASLRDAFVAPASGGGPAGFFDPSRWTFGETVFASAIVAWAKGVCGVADAEVTELSRAPGSPGGAAPPTSLALAADELPRMEDEPLEPQNGTLSIDVSTSDEGWA